MAQTSSRHLAPKALAQIFGQLPSTELKLKSDSLFNQLESLSEREQEVMLALLNPQARRDQVAKNLSISPATLNNHLAAIFQKLGATTIDQARAFFCKMYPEARDVLLAYY